MQKFDAYISSHPFFNRGEQESSSPGFLKHLLAMLTIIKAPFNMGYCDTPSTKQAFRDTGIDRLLFFIFLFPDGAPRYGLTDFPDR